MKPTTILVVEDERIIGKGIEKRLKGLGYAVAGIASTGEEAIRKATELQPDLVLMDIHLGDGMDGVEAAGVVRGELNLPVVFLTAHSDDATLQRARLTEPFGYVLKPYEDRDLQTAIEIGLYRHKIEKRLRESEQWLAATLASIGDGVIATDEKGHVCFLNEQAERLTGWTQLDAYGEDMATVFQIVGETTRRSVADQWLEALATGQSASPPEASILIDKEAVERVIEDTVSPIRDVNGKVSGAVLVFRDITERRRLECQLEEQRHELLEANLRLEALASTDALTRLKNRRAFQEALTEEIKRSLRISSPLSLLLLDVDHFKMFNDVFGHSAGDEALRGVARLLEETARPGDLVARYGGEEFAVILPDADRDEAIEMAELMRGAIAEAEWRERAITVSVGAATLSLGAPSAKAIVEAADAALYWSKRNGRGCVRHADES